MGGFGSALISRTPVSGSIQSGIQQTGALRIACGMLRDPTLPTVLVCPRYRSIDVPCRLETMVESSAVPAATTQGPEAPQSRVELQGIPTAAMQVPRKYRTLMVAAQDLSMLIQHTLANVMRTIRCKRLT